MIVADLLNPTYNPQTGQNEFIDLLIGMMVILGPVLFLLQRLARKEANRATAPAPEATSTQVQQPS
jgi:hypothetical protein